MILSILSLSKNVHVFKKKFIVTDCSEVITIDKLYQEHVKNIHQCKVYAGFKLPSIFFAF